MGNWQIQVASSGSFLDLETSYGFRVQQPLGAGMAPVQNISTSFGLLDGALFQRQRTDVRSMTLVGALKGATVADLHAKRSALIDEVKPDRSASQGPVILRYTGGASTLSASCYYEGGFELGNVDNTTELNIALRFIMYDPYFEKITNSSATLTVQTTFTASYIAQRAASGGWGAVGTGTNGEVKALTSNAAGTLFAGGAFTTAGGAEACRIAQWSGTAWSKVGNAFNNDCNDIVFHPDGTLYAVGTFTTASGAAASRVAQWSGTAWSKVGNAANGAVNTAVLSKTGDLFIGGTFSVASGFSACRVARWNVDRWRSVGAGVASGAGASGAVRKLLFDSASELYAIGDFTVASATTACGVAKFNLSDWWRPVGSCGLHSTAGGTYGWAGGILPSGNLIIGGEFDLADAVTACNVVQWNGAGYNSVGNHVNNDVLGMWPLYGGGLIVGGTFSQLGGLVTSITKGYWNTSVWLPFDIELPLQDDISAAYSASNGVLTLGFGFGGTASAAAVTVVTNNGTATAYPVLTATAPTGGQTDGQGLIRLTQLINYTSGEAIYFNLNMVAGEVVTLDLRPGQKSFKSSFRGNIINTILPGSNVATWKLLPGANNVSLWLTGGSGAAALSWIERFWSCDG